MQFWVRTLFCGFYPFMETLVDMLIFTGIKSSSAALDLIWLVLSSYYSLDGQLKKTIKEFLQFQCLQIEFELTVILRSQMCFKKSQDDSFLVF